MTAGDELERERAIDRAMEMARPVAEQVGWDAIVARLDKLLADLRSLEDKLSAGIDDCEAKVERAAVTT